MTTVLTQITPGKTCSKKTSGWNIWYFLYEREATRSPLRYTVTLKLFVGKKQKALASENCSDYIRMTPFYVFFFFSFFYLCASVNLTRLAFFCLSQFLFLSSFFSLYLGNSNLLSFSWLNATFLQAQHVVQMNYSTWRQMHIQCYRNKRKNSNGWKYN